MQRYVFFNYSTQISCIFLCFCRVFYLSLLREVSEVIVDDGLDEFGSSGVVAVGVVNASEVHEDDACWTCGVGGEIIEDGFVGVGGIVTITVAERDFPAEKGFHFGIGRGEVEDPHKVMRV